MIGHLACTLPSWAYWRLERFTNLNANNTIYIAMTRTRNGEDEIEENDHEKKRDMEISNTEYGLRVK